MSLLMEALRKAEQSKAAVEKKEALIPETVAVSIEQNLPEKPNEDENVNFGSLTLEAKNLLPERKSGENFLDGLTFGDSVDEQKKLLKKTEQIINEKDDALSLSEKSAITNSSADDSGIEKSSNTETVIENYSEPVKNDSEIGIVENTDEQKIELLSGLIDDKKAFISNDSEAIGRAVLAAKIGVETKQKRNRILTLALVSVILVISGLFLYPQIFDKSDSNLSQGLIQSDEFDAINEGFAEVNVIPEEINRDSFEIETVLNNITNEIISITKPEVIGVKPLASNDVVVAGMPENSNQLLDASQDVAPVENVVSNIPEREVNASLFISRDIVSDENSLIDSAYQAYQKGNLIDAKYYYEGVLETNPGHRSALLGLSSIAIKEGRDAAALENYSRLLERDPSDPLAQAGIFNVTEADPLSQESGIKQLINDYPQLPHLEFALGNIFSYQSRWSEAQQAYFNALKKAKATTTVLSEISPDYAYNLAISLEYINKPELAIQYYKEALENANFGSANFDISIVQNRLETLDQ